jgi:drug/metabolite transporter (DMT)-like permease
MPMSNPRAIVAAVVAVLLFGITVVIQGQLVRLEVTAFTSVGLRYVGSTVVCVLLLVVTRRSLAPVAGERVPAFLLGAVAYALQAILFYAALEHGSPGAVSLLFYTYPVLVLLIAVALRLKPWAWTAAISAVLSVAGAAVLISTGRSIVIDPTGVVLALSSSVCVAVYLFANQRFLPRSSALVVSAWVSAGVATSTLLMSVVTGTQGTVTSGAWLWLGISGVTTGVATALMYVALAHLGAPTTSVILSMQVVVAVAGSDLFLGEPITAGQLAGGMGILTAVWLAAWTLRPRQSRDANCPGDPSTDAPEPLR